LSNSEHIKQWSVEDDGALTPTSLSSMSDLSDNNVFIVVDENARKIFIWKGEKAPVRRKFISAKAAQQMRQEKYGMVYRIESLDPGLEGDDFLAIFGAKRKPREEAETPASEREQEVYVRPAQTRTPTPAQTRTPTPAQTRTPTPAQTRTPTPAQTRTPTPAQTRTPTPAQTRTPTPAQTRTPTPAQTRTPTPAKIVRETEVVVTAPAKTTTPPTTLEEVSNILKDLEIPSNLEREIIIIGNMVFSVIKEHLALFSKDVVKLEPMDDLPSGIFPASDYQARLYLKDGRVIFTEMLRQKTRSERDEFVDDMKKSLQDLSKMGI
jgi:hypothetical protein